MQVTHSIYNILENCQHHQRILRRYLCLSASRFPESHCIAALSNKKPRTGRPSVSRLVSLTNSNSLNSHRNHRLAKSLENSMYGGSMFQISEKGKRSSFVAVVASIRGMATAVNAFNLSPCLMNWAVECLMLVHFSCGLTYCGANVEGECARVWNWNVVKRSVTFLRQILRPVRADLQDNAIPSSWRAQNLMVLQNTCLILKIKWDSIDFRRGLLWVQWNFSTTI